MLFTSHNTIAWIQNWCPFETSNFGKRRLSQIWPKDVKVEFIIGLNYFKVNSNHEITIKKTKEVKFSSPQRFEPLSHGTESQFVSNELCQSVFIGIFKEWAIVISKHFELNSMMSVRDSVTKYSGKNTYTHIFYLVREIFNRLWGPSDLGPKRHPFYVSIFYLV